MHRQSLSARLKRVMWGSSGIERERAASVAIFLALAPLATIAGAKLLISAERAEIVRLQDDLAPRLAAENAARTARSEIAAAIARPAMAATLDTLARALPADVTLARAERDARGALDLDVTAVDPDKLRAALRRAPELAGLRDSGQRQGDGTMLVTLHQDAQ